jgi:hypothetical protein
MLVTFLADNEVSPSLGSKSESAISVEIASPQNSLA